MIPVAQAWRGLAPWDVSSAGGAVAPLALAMSVIGRWWLLSLIVLTLSWSPGLCRVVAAGEAASVPSSFAEVAAAALAASIVIRATPPDGLTAGLSPVLAQRGREEEPEDDDTDTDDPSMLRRRLTLGAGVIIHPRGVAVTSARAVLGARRFEVFLLDGTPLDATLIGVDGRTDVAVLKLDRGGQSFPHLVLGDSDSMKIGDWVIAVGAPLGLEGTVAAGVITAVPTPESANPHASFLQTDAVMARATAGGPLVNLRGETVGLTSHLTDETVTYALPAKTLRRISLEILEIGHVRRPWLGIATQSLTPDIARALRAPTGVAVVVADVRPKSPGAGAGLLPGDLVIELNGVAVASRTHFEDLLGAVATGRVVSLKIRRDDVTSLVSVTVAEAPEEGPLPASLSPANRRLGIEVRPLEPATGAVARNIDSWSPAGRAGLRSGDVIHEVNRQPVRTEADFQSVIQTLPLRAPVLVRVQRGSLVLYVVIEATPQ